MMICTRHTLYISVEIMIMESTVSFANMATMTTALTETVKNCCERF